MFSNLFKNKNKDLEQAGVENKVKDDFIVHNMPEADRFSGQTFATSNTSFKPSPSVLPASNLDSHHKIGILIIIGGVILIGALVYAAYFFMIKPAAETTTQSEVLVTPTTTTEPIIEEPVPVVTNPVSEPELPPESLEPVVVTEVVSVLDSDSDGLTDDEENLIGTNPNLADSDGDSFSDMAELKSGYNPLLPEKKLDETTRLSRYKINDNVNVLRENSWEIVRSDSDNAVILADADKSFIQITFQNNEEKLAPTTWYDKQFSGLMPGEAVSGDFWSGFYSQDNLAAYLFNQDQSKIYTVVYSPLVENDLNLQFFRLLVKTMIIK